MTNKLQIHVAMGAPQFDVSNFPAEAKRGGTPPASVMFFRQNTVVNVTADELKHIKAVRPDMVKYFTVKEIVKPTAEQLKSRMGAKKKAEASRPKVDVDVTTGTLAPSPVVIDGGDDAAISVGSPPLDEKSPKSKKNR
jgi:hypothetical protein